MKLRCKECGEDFDGEPELAWLCESDYRMYIEDCHYSDEEILEEFGPTEVDLEGLDDDEV